jgi:hypothetical protein
VYVLAPIESRVANARDEKLPSIILVLSIHASAVFAIHAEYIVESDLIVCNILCGAVPPIATLLSNVIVPPLDFVVKANVNTAVLPIVTT